MSIYRHDDRIQNFGLGGPSIKALDVTILDNPFLIGRSPLSNRKLRRKGGWEITAIYGPGKAGKSILAEALVESLRARGYRAGFLPEVIQEEEEGERQRERPWEREDMVCPLWRPKFEERWEMGDFIAVYERSRGVGGKTKTAAVSASILADCLHRYDVTITTVNLMAMGEVQNYFPIKFGQITVIPVGHEVMQKTRGGADEFEGEGEVTWYGVATPPHLQKETLWWYNEWLPQVSHFAPHQEAERREMLIRLYLQLFKQPLNEKTRQLFDETIRAEHLPKTLGEYLDRVVLRKFGIGKRGVYLRYNSL